MEKKTLEVDENSVNVLVAFFNLLGYETYARELSHAWAQYVQKTRALFNTRPESSGHETIDALFITAKGRMAEYENAYGEIKKAFDHFASKITVMLEDAK